MLMEAHARILTKITAAQNEVALSYHRMRGIYFLLVIFATTICYMFAMDDLVTIDTTQYTLYSIHSIQYTVYLNFHNHHVYLHQRKASYAVVISYDNERFQISHF